MTSEIKNLSELVKRTIGGEVVEQTVTLLLPPGENYGSVMKKVDFKIKKGDKTETYHAVAKCTPVNKVTQQLFKTQLTFKTEIGWYTTVIPTLKRFLRDQGSEEDLEYFQKFYGARISLDPTSDVVDLDGVLLTQNLKYLGYKNIDRYEGFEPNAVKSIIRVLASFHAIFLAIRLKEPGTFEKNIAPYLPHLLFDDEEFSEQVKKDILQVFEQIPECVHLVERLEKVFSETSAYGHELREPWITVVHEDVWSNNVMITDDLEPKVMLLDLQIPTIGSPASDLIFFLLTSVNIDILKDELDNYIKYYHEEFHNNLTSLKIPQHHFSYEEFLEEIRLEMQGGQFLHTLQHSLVILAEKGVSTCDTSVPDYKMEDLSNNLVSINDRVIRNFRWIGLESEKRDWI